MLRHVSYSIAVIVEYVASHLCRQQPQRYILSVLRQPLALAIQIQYPFIGL